MSPKNTEELKALTAEDVKPTEAHISLAKYLTEFGPVPVTPEQAYAFIMGHRPWQSGPERAAEKEELKIEKAKADEAKKAELEEKRAAKALEKEAADKAKAEKKAAAAAAKAAREAAGEATSDDSDLDDADEGDEGAPVKKTRRRPAPKSTSPAETGEF